jgi:hypothetical protein
MPANRQKTLDDLEPVIPLHLEEVIENRRATQKGGSNYASCNCDGKRLYEKIQEQKLLEADFDPLFD